MFWQVICESNYKGIVPNLSLSLSLACKNPFSLSLSLSHFEVCLHANQFLQYFTFSTPKAFNPELDVFSASFM